MKYIVIFFALFSEFSFAGNRVGNGGDIVFCEKQRSYEILDFHEARLNSVVVSKSKKSDPYKIVKERLELLKPLAPALHKQYTRRLKSLRSDIEFRESIDLTDVKDSLHAFLGKGCKVKQAALRLGYPKYNKGKRFVFDKGLWGKLKANEQAGLLMHEIFYEHVFKLGLKDSRPVRQFVAFLFSEKINSISKPKFWANINEWGVPIYPQ